MGKNCTCPDFPVENVCKHVLAAALAAEALSHEDARRLLRRQARLGEIIAIEGSEALADRLIRWKTQAPELLAEIEERNGIEPPSPIRVQEEPAD